MTLRNTLVVYEYQAALLYRDGRYVRTLGSGRYRFWADWITRHETTWELFDLREQSLTVAGQEILTKDKVPVRLTLASTYRVIDPVVAQQKVESWSSELYLDLQLALREAVAALAFDELLDLKNNLGAAVRVAVAARVAEYGVELRQVAVRDVTMPANIREIMLQTVAAEKAAQASLIKAREEVAAARARANAAKLLAESAGALRLKELETLVEIAKSGGNTLVLGGFDTSALRVGV